MCRGIPLEGVSHKKKDTGMTYPTPARIEQASPAVKPVQPNTQMTTPNQPAPPQVKARQSKLMNALSNDATKDVCDSKIGFDYFPCLVYDMPPLP